MESQYTAAQRAEMLDTLNRAMQWILDRTVPLFALAPRGVPVLEGTGVLVQIADAHFLFTAAHVVGGIVKDGRALLFGTQDGLFSLEGLDVKVSDDREDVDVAFIRMPQQLADEVAPRKSFVRLSEVDMERRAPRVGSYGVLGFPRGLRTLDPASGFQRPDPYWILGSLYEGVPDRFTVGQSIAVGFTPHSYEDHTGKRARHPALQGISGCGIWRIIGPDDGEPGTSWDPAEMIKLAGIEHGTIGDAIKGVLAFRAIDAIGQNYSDLKPAIELHRAKIDEALSSR